MGKLDEIKEQLEKQLQEQLESNLKIRKELIKNLSEHETESFQPKDIDKEIRKQAADDDHHDRINDRQLKKDWAEKILLGLFVYGICNFILLICYGLGLLKFPDTDVIKIFLGGNVIAVPTIAIYITRSLFPTKK